MHTSRSTRMQASRPPYGCAIRTGQMIFIKIIFLTFWHTKYENCKPEHAEKDSHCHAQREQGRLE